MLKTFLKLSNTIEPYPRKHYVDHYFNIPDGVSKISAKLMYHRKHRVQLFLSLFDPSKYRGTRMNLSDYGELETELWVATLSSSPGGITGPIPSGQWKALIDIDHCNETTEYTLEILVEFGEVENFTQSNFFIDNVKNPEFGWYKGELHCHSNESDGKYPIKEVVDAARKENLDFLALSDHFTYSQWKIIPEYVKEKILLIPSIEITSHHGHANLHGLNKWVDVFVDLEDRNMNMAADDVHQQNGLFCINHPFSNGCNWKDFSFDWSKADLIEIYHNLEGANNNFHIPFWDHLLLSGYRIIGVAGTDSHDPFTGNHRLGQLFTWIYSEELSVKGILQGLKSGSVYVSKGPEINFSIENSEGKSALMGGIIPSLNQPIKLRIKYKSNSQLRVFIIKNGLLLDSQEIFPHKDDWGEVIIMDLPEIDCYYRLEFHTINDEQENPWIQKRDYTTTAAISNPIWVKIFQSEHLNQYD